MIGATMFSGIDAPEVSCPAIDWAWRAEIDPFANRVSQHHRPDTPNLGDVSAPDFIERAIAHGRPDIVVFGSPCQSFSIAGKRLGLDDPRGNMALVALGVIERLQPRWFVFENVPGLFSSDEGRDFAAFLGAVEDCGYLGCWRVLDAQYAGVPQRRRRVFFVGYLGDWRPPAAVLLEPESLRWDPPPRRETGEGIAPTIASRPTGGGGLGTDFDCDGGLIASTGNVAHCLNAGGMGRQDYETETLVAHSLRGEGFDASEDGTGRGTPIVAFDCKASGRNGFGVGEVSPTLRAMGHAGSHQNAGGQVAVAFAENSRAELRLCGGDGSVSSQLTTGGGKPGQGQPCIAFQERGRANGRELEIGGDVAYALTAPNGGGRAQERNVLTPSMAVRRLTPRECERLQGFPDDHTQVPWRGKPADKCPDGPRYKALGNSMAVPVIGGILDRIVKFEGMA